jgi:polyphosphate kinase
MISFRCELLSADQLGMLASGPLPSGLSAGDASRSLHRDVYLDTADDSLGRRGVICRLRTHADGKGTLTLRIASSPVNLEVPTHGADVADALAARNDVTRRLRGIVDPSALQVRVDLEVDRLTRSALSDWLGRARLAIHLDRVSVRRNGHSGAASFFQMCAHRLRGGDAELADLERALEQQHGIRASGLGSRERAELALKWARLDEGSRVRRLSYSDRITRASTRTPTTSTPSLLNAELSLLSFQHRVLSLAEDPATPLAERLRFLAIVSANVDEFFMVRMAGLTAAAGESSEEQADDGLMPTEQIAAIRDSVREISARQATCLRDCLAELGKHGVHLRRWAELTPEQRENLTSRFRDEIHPLLTPFAMTLSPGHPLPRLAHLSLAIATIVRNRAGGPPRFAELELPRGAPRFYALDDEGSRVFVSLEEVVQGNLEAMYPDSTLEQAFVFRVTRSAELELDEAGADDLLEEVARAAAARGSGVAVRLEVDRGMPGILRALLLEDLRREQAAGDVPLDDVEEVDGLIDLAGLTQLELPAGVVPRYPRFAAVDPFAGSPIFDAISRGDVLLHHPFESFAASVGRFVREAADDPAVLAIKITLYRVGDPSPIADALLDAARAGKAVTAFVELKARFDEAVNVNWARALEAAGGHVVRGLVGYKNHAKVALVVRRNGESLERFVHIGTGNYNIRSGEQYTDLSLFTCDETIASDVAHLFNDLTGLSEPPRRASRALLVAPHRLLPGILERIEREAAIARAGRPARITCKVNGLSDPDVVRALYRASQDGVEIDLVVRGICTLTPGVAGRSERIRVRSIVGRFLEHSRIYRFENDGDPAYYIGSADLRPRNLRRRVELLVPVTNADHRRRLDEILDAYSSDPTAWELDQHGDYVRRPVAGASAQEAMTRKTRAPSNASTNGH